MSSSFFRRTYYTLKPWVPSRVRMGVRRWFALRKRIRTQNVWPIYAGSETPPDGWPGWPDGKQFALVLTHDVEGKRGLEKCRRLMELEHSLGFRSCFNFIPEGEYRVSRQFRNELVQTGFEVGVHDLRHDGTLYGSREEFSAQAGRINAHLQDWDAVGFRAGFMRHNLAWQHALRIRYDCSTFDTDPFEPQPDGVHTIFPFWVPRCGSEIRNPKSDIQSEGSRNADHATRGGYVELPYTLPQDSTLFLLFQEKTPEVWFRKLDWVAQNGGMALLNVHPDYLRFPGSPLSRRTFPVELYEQLLEYVRTHYAGQYWHALPREVAAYVAALSRPVTHRLRRHVCIISYSVYESDARVSRYGQALAERGDEVDVFAIRAGSHTPKLATVGGARVFKIQTRVRNERSKVSYLLPLLRFLGVCAWRVARQHAQRPYDAVHVHNVPDFLVFAAFWPKLQGARVILDIHDIVPELFTSKFSTNHNSILVRLLKLMERVSAAVADHVILANHLWLEKYTTRAAPAEKCSVLINYVDQRNFSPQWRCRSDDRQIVLFPGTLQWHQGLDVGIRAFALLKDRLPHAQFHIYGEGPKKSELRELVAELGLEARVQFFGTLPLKEIAKVMANADLGVVPKRADSFGNEAYSTKIMDFMAVNVPVVVSNTKIDKYYFNDSTVRFFESGSAPAMAEAMYEVLTNAGLRRRLVQAGAEYAKANTWESQRGVYLKLVDSLCSGSDVSLVNQAAAELKSPPTMAGITG